MSEIVQKENPVLRGIAAPVAVQDITSAKIQKILARMKAAMSEQDDGVGIAAPQIGEPLRIFVISKKVFDIIDSREEEDAEEKPAPKRKRAMPDEDLVFINPEIIKLSKDKEWLEEGCLSVRYLYGKIRRSTRATIRAWNEKGELFERGASGLLAQIFQHEVDHLNGILFIDNAKDVEDLPPKGAKGHKHVPQE